MDRLGHRLVVARGGGGCWAKRGERIKRYKLPVIKHISHGNVMYSLMAIINTALYI